MNDVVVRAEGLRKSYGSTPVLRGVDLALHRGEVLSLLGANGAGKTTTLAATKTALAEQGRRLMVVTPTLKAAQVAAAEVGAVAGSAARLAFEYGWRWNDDGAWTTEKRAR